MNHIIVFSELTTGKLKTMLTANCTFRDALEMVQSVNKKTIYKNVVKSQAEQLINELDHKQLGYKESDDFNISFIPCKNPDNVNIVITPACIYNLYEPFNFPAAPDKRSQLFLALFCDEFERIKVRVFHAVNESFDSSLFSMDAYKAMVFIKTCFRSQRIVFQEHLLKYPAYRLNPDAYINYMLAFFIIKVQVYFAKIFKEALAEEEKNEAQLFDELFRIDPVVLKKFNVTPAYSPPAASENVSSEIIATNNYKTSTAPLQGFDANESLNTAFDIISQKYVLKPEILKTVVKLIGKCNWNGNANTLGDILYQLMHVLKEDDKFLLEAPDSVIAELTQMMLTWKGNQTLSKSTIRTHLQKNSTLKRPKEGESNKIDVSKLINASTKR